MARKIIKKLIIGKHILDTLSIGMYNNPLMLFREYIQNSVDAIDQLARSRKGYVKNSRIEININGRARSITIQDNATGIKAKDALRKLHDIGRSSKKVKTNRGFRGIGRLGGLGYCEELRFITKAKNESIYSVSKWDCAKLRKLISNDNDSLDVIKLVKNVAELSQYKYTKNKRDHFFIVEMYNVRSSRNVLLDVPIIKSYLSQVVPVPFKDDFSHKGEIEKTLKSKISNYETYQIFVNGEQVFKPYIDSVKVGDRKTDRIKNIDFVEFSNGNGTLTFGWIANLELLGRVSSTGLVDGVRLRSGNILVGDKDLLCDCFRERRFNSYLVGELHVVDHRLVLNSRRDDFEDSQHKEEFYNHFIKEIGLPFSRKIREASEERSQNRNELLSSKLIGTAKNIINKGYIAERQKEEIIIELISLKSGNNLDINSEGIDKLLSLLNSSVHFLDLKKRKAKISSQKKIMLKSMFDIVYKECTNKEQAGKIVNKIVKQI
jgi:molecular chaperone HtpG